jgi:hypothetical protein
MSPFDLYQPSFFTEDEFQGWSMFLDVALLIKLDAFRGAWGHAVRISPAPGAVGRRDDSNSQHNIKKWGTVRAVDIMPDGILTADDLQQAQYTAIVVGFTGVGVYPHWQPAPGLHVDVRTSHAPGNPGLWGAIRPDREQPQQMVSVDDALAAFTEVPA